MSRFTKGFGIREVYRLHLCVASLIVGYLGVNDPFALMYKATSARDEHLVLFVMFASSILGLLDLFFNDFLKIKIELLKRHRHFILASMAFCHISQVFIVYPNSGRSTTILFFYLWHGFSIILLSYLDAKTRFEEGKKCALA